MVLEKIRMENLTSIKNSKTSNSIKFGTIGFIYLPCDSTFYLILLVCSILVLHLFGINTALRPPLYILYTVLFSSLSHWVQ